MRASFIKVLSATSLAAISTAQAFGQAADVVFIVDESGSMQGEQQFLQTFVPDLATRLGSAGVLTTRFGLVGYGDSAVVPRQVSVGGGQFGTAAEFATAAGTLTTSGGTEDGYAGINFALQNYAFSNDPNATRLVVLVTDEDRDDTDPTLSASSIANDLATRNVFFAGILNQGVEDPNGVTAIGASATQTFLDQDGDGQFEISGPPVFTSAGGNTQADYTDVILAQPNGCFADLNALRAGGTPAQAFASVLSSCILTIVTGPSGTDPYVIYASRDTMLAFAQSFATQMSFRLTGRLSGPDRDNGNGESALVSSYGPTVTTTFPTRVFGADIGELPQGTREFTLGGLKGYVTLQGEYAETDYDAPFVNYERKSFSGSLGLDYEFIPGTLMGVAFGYHSSDADSEIDDVDADAFSLGLYGGTKLGARGYLDATLQYSWGDVDTERTTAGGTASGSTDIEVFTATATLGTVFEAGRFEINPSVWLGYSHISSDEFTETGPGAITFAPEDVDVFWATPRVDVLMPLQTNWGEIIPTAGLGVRFQGGDEGTVVTTTAGGTTSALALPDMDEVSLLTNVGVAFTNNQNTVAARIDYTGTFGENVTSHAANFRLRIAF